jgi:hypothetical protein
MGRQTDIAEDKKGFKAVDLAFDIAFNKDLKKAYNGNKAACRRMRKAFLKLEKGCKTGRNELLEILKTKLR